ncbi:ATP-dependent DNA ligase, partial [bacterium]|nr:ATP-dependent DNA ligase [bacterium]
PEDISSFYQAILNSKGEGLIARAANASYDWDNRSRRSNVMIKVKPTITSEFLAVGHSYERRFVKGVGYDLILYTCVTSDGTTFTVTPEGDVESRCIQPPDFDDDSWYTVEYRELT